MLRTTPVVRALALLIVVVALCLRVVGIDWDRRRLLHPDERFLVVTTAALGVPDSLAAYLDADRSPLNPRRADRSFAYGTLPLTLTRVATVATGPSLGAITLTGRAISAAADMGTLVLLGWLARRLYGAHTALLAMSLYAFAVLPIQHSHFFVVESLLTWWCLVAIAALTLWHRQPHVMTAAMAGAGFALAVACKVSALMLVAPTALVFGVHLLREGGVGPPASRARSVAWGVVAYGAAALATLRLAAPDMFAAGWLPWPNDLWLADLRTTARLAAGGDDAPPSFQWAGREPWVLWWNTVRYGLGLPLGVAATAAAAGATWRVLGQWRSSLLVPTAWAVVMTIVVSLQFVAAMRYLLPAYPTFCLLAAAGLTALHRRASGSSTRWHRPAASALVVVVVAGTAAWALAFTSIYRDLHPRLAASRWIFDTIPAGAVLTAEAWDDALPISASLRTHASRYQVLTLPVTDEDAPAKLEALLAMLDRADYVVLSSDRLAGSLVRLPRRFPMMVRYYEALADGRLGFDRAAEFTSVPRLGPFSWNDGSAEEAFTVYDHPRVRIYRKSAAWSVGRARSLLGPVEWADVLRTTARQASAAPALLELPQVRRAALEGDGTWRTGVGSGGRFGPPASDLAAAARWLCVLLLVTLLAWPACAVLLPDTWGRGLLAAPAFGLVWLAWVIWVWGTLSPWPLSRGVIVAALLATGVASAAMVWPRRHGWRAWLTTHGATCGAHLAALVLVGAAGVAIRTMNPDLWHPLLGGEKPMDIAILTALVRADHFPAYDPWFAGGTLNYYYFGFLPVALLCRLTGVEPALGYTLATGTWWALTGGMLALVAGTLVCERRRNRARDATPRATTAVWWAAAAAVLLGIVCGNLRQWEVAWRWTREGVEPYLWFWHASRAIPVPHGEVPPITEFPAFTFLFADLHAHLLSMPWLLGVVLVATQLVGRPEWPWPVRLPRIAVGGLLVGMLAATNAWDVPTALLLLAAALAVRMYSQADRPLPLAVRGWLVEVLLAVTVAALAAWPFWTSFAAPVGGPRPWRGPYTPLAAALLIHGPFLLVVVPALVVLARRLVRSRHSSSSPVDLWTGLLCAVGLLLVALVEVVAVQGDVGRMNSVFKAYLQVWLLWSAVVPAAWLLVHDALSAGSSSSLVRRRVFETLTLGTLATMLLYPVTAIGPRLASRISPDAPRGLDGTAFMTGAAVSTPQGNLSLRDDHVLIRWLLDHARGTPTIIEAQTDAYQWGGRISAHTGLPTVLGWTWHTRQQRLALPAAVIGRRRRDVEQFYTASSADAAWDVARRYDVRYAIVGELEHQRYPAGSLARLADDPRWVARVRSGRSVVYERRD